MKTIIPMLLLIPILASTQLEITYQNVLKKEGRYGSYLTKSGAIVSLKDSISIGLPTEPEGFRFITMGWESADNILVGRKVPIEGIRTFKRNWLSNKVFFAV